MNPLRIPLVKNNQSRKYSIVIFCIGVAVCILSVSHILYLALSGLKTFDTSFPGDWYLFLLFLFGIYFVFGHLKNNRMAGYYFSIDHNTIEFLTPQISEVKKIPLNDLEKISSKNAVLQFILTNNEIYEVDFSRAGKGALSNLKNKIIEITPAT